MNRCLLSLDRLHYLIPQPKRRNVRSFGYNENDWFCLPLGREIPIQPLPKPPDFHPDNIVLAGAVVPAALEDLPTDQLLAQFFRPVLQGTLADVQKEFPKPRRLLKRSARRDPLYETPLRFDRQRGRTRLRR